MAQQKIDRLIKPFIDSGKWYLSKAYPVYSNNEWIAFLRNDDGEILRLSLNVAPDEEMHEDIFDQFI